MNQSTPTRRRGLAAGVALLIALGGSAIVGLSGADAANPPVVLSPTSGPAGTAITVALPSPCGSATAASELDLDFSPVVGDQSFAHVTVPVAQHATVTQAMIDAPANARRGSYVVSAYCVNLSTFAFTRYGNSYFDVTGGTALPSLTVTPTSGPVGTTIDVSASCSPVPGQPAPVFSAVLFSPTDPDGTHTVYRDTSGAGPIQHVILSVPAGFPIGAARIGASCFDYAATHSFAETTFTVTGTGALPSVVPGAVSVVEGNSGSKTVLVPVSLSAVSGQTVTASWSTVNSSAVAPGDYVAGSGTVTFAPGQTSQTVAVSVKGDTVNEANEGFFVSFTSPTNATIGGFYGLGAVTITNDDPVPSVVPGAVSVVEGNSGSKMVLVPVSLSAVSGQTVTASWSTVNSSAVAPGDYVAGSGTVTFAPGQTSQTVAVSVKGDTVNEANEGFFVSFTSPTNATIGGFYGLGAVTITNDDPVPSVVPGAVSVVEGNSGSKMVLVPVSLSAVSGQTVTASWSTVNSSAVAPGDYVAGSGTVTFAPGQTSQTVAVSVNGDTVKEVNEGFFVSFTSPTNATIGGFYGLGAVTITNDD